MVSLDAIGAYKKDVQNNRFVLTSFHVISNQTTLSKHLFLCMLTLEGNLLSFFFRYTLPNDHCNKPNNGYDVQQATEIVMNYITEIVRNANLFLCVK